MGTKNNPSKYDCYANADPDEQMFILLGRDKHAPALVRLWADIREKEGEDPELVAEARATADEMEKQVIERGKPVLSLQALTSFIITNYKQPQEELKTTVYKPQDPVKEKDYVITARGNTVGIIETIITDNDGVKRANVKFGRNPTGQVTVLYDTLRKPTEEELQRHLK